MSKTDILNRIISFYNLKNKTGLANFLDVSPQTISNWYSRDSIDYELIFNKCNGIDLNWLIAGNSTQSYQTNTNKVSIACDTNRTYESGELQNTSLPIINSFNFTITEANSPLSTTDNNTITIPGNMISHNEEYVAFKLEENAMKPAYMAGNYAICKRVVNMTPETLLVNEIYLFALFSGDLVFRRMRHLQKSSKKVFLSADNITGAEIPIIEIHASEIKAAWNAKFAFTATDSQSIHEITNRIAKLEKMVENLLRHSSDL